jgi:trigger factor
MMNYECKVETKSDISRELTISVKPEVIQNYVEKQFEALQKKAKIKGFRQGKVPMAILKREYHGDVKADAVTKIIQDCYSLAIEENKIRTVGSPQITPKSGWDLRDGEAFVFVAKVEVFPTVSVKDLSKISVKRESAEVNDDDVQKSLNGLIDSHAEVEPDESRTSPAKDGDFVVITFKGALDGAHKDELFGENRLVEIGKRSYMEDFERQLIGMSKGSTKEFDVTFPKDFNDKLYAEKTVHFQVTLHEFKKQVKPELNDEFAKRFKLETAEELKNKVRESLVENKREESQTKLKNDLVAELVKANPFEVPKHFVHTQLDFLVRENQQFLKERGFTPKMIEEYLSKSATSLEAKAEDQVRVSLIFDRIAQDADIKVEAADLDREFARISEKEGVPVDKVKEYLSNEDSLRQLRFKIKEERTVDYILSQVKIKG